MKTNKPTNPSTQNRLSSKAVPVKDRASHYGHPLPSTDHKGHVMSVTFTPAAGTWTAYEYYNDCVSDPSCPNNEANNILRVAHEMPSINHCNARAAKIMDILGFGSRIIHEDGTREPVLYGRLPAHRIPALYAKLYQCLDPDEYPIVQWSTTLLHCMFHNCDLVYG